MIDHFENSYAPFVPKEEVFNDMPIRGSTEKKKGGFAAFLKDTGNEKQE